LRVTGTELEQEDRCMSLLRSICCLFGGRCAGEESKPTTETMRREAPGDLGQREAERERASEDQLRHMESGATSANLDESAPRSVKVVAGACNHRELTLPPVHI